MNSAGSRIMHTVSMLHGESAVPSVPTPVPLTSFQKMIETQDYVFNLCEDKWLKKKKRARQCVADTDRWLERQHSILAHYPSTVLRVINSASPWVSTWCFRKRVP